MQMHSLDDSRLPIRDDLKVSIETAWSQIPQTGAWLSGQQRLGVVAEARQAWLCELCQRRKASLSPYVTEGAHDSLDQLPPTWVEVIHRIVTDPGRITESWYESVIGAGVLEDEYIEILSLATIVTCIDTFTDALGMERWSLPESAESGSPECRRPLGAAVGPGWALTVSPDAAGPELGNFYDHGHQYIRRSLTLVPDELNRFWSLMNSLYMANPAVDELEGVDRAISRAQIEFIATRVSAYLDCFY